MSARRVFESVGCSPPTGLEFPSRSPSGTLRTLGTSPPARPVLAVFVSGSLASVVLEMEMKKVLVCCLLLSLQCEDKYTAQPGWHCPPYTHGRRSSTLSIHDDRQRAKGGGKVNKHPTTRRARETGQSNYTLVKRELYTRVTRVLGRVDWGDVKIRRLAGWV